MVILERTVIRDLIQTRDGTTYFMEKISDIHLRYDLGGDPPLIGRSAPDFEFEDDRRLGDLLHGGKGVLIDFSENQTFAGLIQARTNRLQYLVARAKDTKGLTAALIRPDGFVAWATEGGPDMQEATSSVERWFGRA